MAAPVIEIPVNEVPIPEHVLPQDARASDASGLSYYEGLLPAYLPGESNAKWNQFLKDEDLALGEEEQQRSQSDVDVFSLVWNRSKRNQGQQFLMGKYGDKNWAPGMRKSMEAYMDAMLTLGKEISLEVAHNHLMCCFDEHLEGLLLSEDEASMMKAAIIINRANKNWHRWEAAKRRGANAFNFNEQH